MILQALKYLPIINPAWIKFILPPYGTGYFLPRKAEQELASDRKTGLKTCSF